MACLCRDIDNTHSVTVVFDLQGPCGGEELLQSIGDTFNIPRRTRDNPGGKLIYLVDPRTREVAAFTFLPCSCAATWPYLIMFPFHRNGGLQIIDIDKEFCEESVYEVQVSSRLRNLLPLECMLLPKT